LMVERRENLNNWVTKPFKKDGSYTVITQRWMEDAGYSGTDIVGGPFSRVYIRRIDIDSAMELKDFLLALGWKPAQWNTNSEGVKTSPKLSKEDPFEGIQGSVGRLIAKRVLCKHRLSVLEGWKAAL